MGTSLSRFAGWAGAAKNSYERRIADFWRARRSGIEMKGVLLLALVALGCTPAHSAYVPRDPELQREPLYFYPARSRPKAGVFFLGNDLGFWEPHQKLAERLANDGFGVVGFDVE